MDEGARERRLRWIAWSLRPELRPLALAAVVRGRGGAPPSLPISAGDLAIDFPLRPSDQQWFLRSAPDLEDAARIDRMAADEGTTILTPEEGGWPGKLWEELADPPAALYVRGRLHQPEDSAVAIVGARHASPNGLALARSIARDLACSGVTIVSGLALGIDGSSHRGALDAGGRTVAVLAGGVDRPSPPSHVGLAATIETTGALVSEFPPGTEPRPLHFPRRNRILAALASVLLVVEGMGRSGARSTVDHALALGRDVAAVPRDPVHEGSVLPNGMLQSGAAVVTSAVDLLRLLGLGERPVRTESAPAAVAQGSFLDSGDREILESLGGGRRAVDAVARRARRTPAEVMASLGRLELAGRVRRLHGTRYERIGPLR
jgi:DNA processing protein